MATEDQPSRPQLDTNAPHAPTDDNANNTQPQPQPQSQAPPPSQPQQTTSTPKTQDATDAPLPPPPPPQTTTTATTALQQPPPTKPLPPPLQHPSTSATPTSPPLPTRHTAATPGPRAQRLQEMFDLALSRTLTRISPDNFASCYPTVAARAPHVLHQVQRAMVDRFAELCAQGFADALARYGVVARLNELEGLVSDAEGRRRRAAAAAAAGRKGKGKGKGKGKEGDMDVDVDMDGDGDEDQEQQEGDGEKKNSRSKPKTKAQTKPEPEPEPPTPPHMLPAEAILAAHLAPHLAGQQGQMNARLQNTQAANAALWGAIQEQRREVEALLGALERALADVDGAAALMDGVPAGELARESRAVEAEMADV